jgi:AraC-like DNA-binding protein
MARPQKKIDEIMLEKLTKLHLSDQTIADCLGCSVWTLERRYAQKMIEWRSKSKSKIADVLFDEAINKREPWALKALAQKHLDYHDKVKTDFNNVTPERKFTDEELEKAISKELEAEINDRVEQELKKRLEKK